MKKTVLILVIVAAATAAVYWADKATRVHTNAASRLVVMKAGGAAPEIKVKDLEDKDVTLEDFKGKVVLVNFWATWCDPCRVEIPWLIEMQDKYGSKGFTVLGIAMDDEGKPVTGVKRTTYLIGPDEGKGQKLIHVFEDVKPEGHAEEVFALIKAQKEKK